MIRVKTTRLALRPLEVTDAPAMLEYFSSEESCRYIPWEPRDISGVLEFIEKWKSPQKPQQDSDSLVLGIDVPDIGIVGQLNFTYKSKINQHGEFGYILNPAHRGKGFASEAVRALLDWLWTEVDLNRVTAVIDERNQPSIELAKRVGMRQEARFIESEFSKGEWATMLIFALRRSEWAASR